MLDEIMAWLPWICRAIAWVAAYAIFETYVLPKFPKLNKFLNKIMWGETENV